MSNLLKEFKRRNVFRVAALYLVVAWLLLQVSGALESSLHLPEWFDSLVAALLILGLPVALICAWAFELTRDGFKRTTTLGADELPSLDKDRKLDYLLIASMLTIVALIVWQMLLGQGKEFSDSIDVSKEHNVNADALSIAVLPFTDLSAEKNQEYFADGISEEILNVLSKVPELAVAGRTSSFAFKGRNEDLRQIGHALGVAHILEGSVRKDGPNIRVTAQLIEVKGGFHLWSETYDRELIDIFAIQDDVAAQIFSALTNTLLGQSRTLSAAPQPVTTPEAYDLYLLAKQRIYSREADQLRSAVELLDRAIAADPDYAPAYAQRALAEILLSEGQTPGGAPTLEAVAVAMPLVNKALELDPNLAEGHGVKGLVLDTEHKQPDEAEAALRKALEINPNLNSVRNWLASHLKMTGRFQESLLVFEEASKNDPLFPPVLTNLTFNYVLYGQPEKAKKLIDRIRPILANPEVLVPLDALFHIVSGEYAKGLQLLKNSYDRGSRSIQVVSNYANVLLLIGAYEESLALDYQSTSAFALLGLGRIDESLALATALKNTGHSPLSTIQLAELYLRVGQPEVVVKHIDDNLDGLDNLIRLYPEYEAPGAQSYALIALCYRRLGREKEAQQALDYQAQSDAEQRSRGAQLGFIDLSEASNAAMNGNSDLAFAKLEKALAMHMPGASIDTHPVYESLHTDPRWDNIAAQFLTNTNAVRIKFGLQPILVPEY
jgi:TolB-like protein/tetratricopeptide (TPR) repeat protein